LVEFWNKTQTFELFPMLSLLTDVVYNTHNIVVACPTGVRTGWDSVVSREDKFTDPTHYMDNIIFNFGMIFDNVRDAIIWFEYGSYGEANGPYNTGYSLGNSIYFTFFKENSSRRPG
jgi:hypothetical protein